MLVWYSKPYSNIWSVINWLCSLDVTLQQIKGDLTACVWTDPSSLDCSVSSDTPLSELAYYRCHHIDHDNATAGSHTGSFGKRLHNPHLSDWHCPDISPCNFWLFFFFFFHHFKENVKRHDNSFKRTLKIFREDTGISVWNYIESTLEVMWDPMGSILRSYREYFEAE